ncbi:hypothetical protein ACPV5O_27030 [Vibrio maritimus]|uniref:hypothetical protein n=1 Tax=Vibrio maritimus TaxID=990268 RepID=UPI00406972A6
MLFLVLSGCYGEDDKSHHNIEEKNNYILQLSSSEVQIREPNAGYSLNDVDIIKKGNDLLVIANGTPRILSNPLVKIEGFIYKVLGEVQPFSNAFIETDIILSDESEMAFIEEQPFFNVKITEFKEDVNKPLEWPKPSSFNIEQYNNEILAIKSLSNDTRFVRHLANYIHDYDKKRDIVSLYKNNYLPNCSSAEHRTVDIKGDNLNFKSKDTDTTVNKLFSYLLHAPSAIYHMYAPSPDNNIVGKATIGNGWLGMKERAMYPYGYRGFNGFLHEKMHNHGFNHSGGMTSGLDQVIPKYYENNWDNYFDHTFQVNRSYPILISSKSDNNGFVFEFFDKNQTITNVELNEFIIAVNQNVEILKVVLIDDSNNKKVIAPNDSGIIGDSKILFFNGAFSVIPSKLNEKALSKLYLELGGTYNDKSGIIVMATSTKHPEVQAAIFKLIGGEG